MASPVATTIHWTAGRLAHSPTNLATAFPCGGTALGATAQVRLIVESGHAPIRAQEWDGAAWDSLWFERDVILQVVMRGVDNDAISVLWPGAAAGASTNQLVTFPQKTTSLLLSTRAKKIIFVPNDTTNHRAIILYNALPALVRPELSFSLLGANSWVVLFVGSRDTNKKIGQMGVLSDLSVNSS